eukprot:CAMPEP_0119274686 /NCGR_PEP_ID=MMETSP1329-20130426/12630_1 /TAXON_ID=114041 /ORGANISM="Genus nov. species nov., Strain RCC1024" /LENGTH=49 /DNA_ID= /DNA_START= /DNA_END= /DNA_ORIENTATION=
MARETQRLHVAGLAPGVTPEDLEALFGSVTPVLRAEVAPPKNGMERGFG